MPGTFIGYSDEIKRIEEAITGFRPGSHSNMAIISGPYAGKTTLMDFLYHRFPGRSTRITIPPRFDDIGDALKQLLTYPGEIIFIDDCHLLYRRMVGGFEEIEVFLEQIAIMQDHMFITTWNSFSWEYLSRAMHIEKHFPCRIELPEFEVEEIKSILMFPYKTAEILFESEEGNGIEHFLELKEYPLHLKSIDRTINIPYPKLNYSFLKERFQQDEEGSTPEDLAFIKIKDISSGNILISKVIWQKSLHNSTIRVNEIYSPSFDVELDYDTGFLAHVILSMGRLHRDDLETAAGSAVDVTGSLAMLREYGIVEVKDDLCSVRPEAVSFILDLVSDARMI